MKRVKAIFIIWILLAGCIYILNGSHAAAAIALIAVIYALLAFIMVKISGRDIKADMKGGSSIEKNEQAKISVETENGSKIPVPKLTLSLKCENILTKEKREIPLTYYYGPKGKNKGGLVLTGGNCGRVKLSVEDALVTDPLGLFKKKRKVDAEASVYVMPEIKKIEIPSEYLDAYDMESYTYSQRQKGLDTGEVFGIREYRDGDSPKQIHWKLSAKMDDLMVKIPSFPIENKLLVILDNSAPEADVLDAERRSALMELFFSLSHTLLEKNIPHSLGWVDHESGSFVLKRAETIDGMWEAVPDALGAGMEKGTASTVYRYLEESREDHFTNHFIVTAGEPADTERLEEYGAVRLFRSE